MPWYSPKGRTSLRPMSRASTALLPDFGVLIQGKVAGVEGEVRVEEEPHALEEGALDAGRPAPEEAMVDEEDLGPRGRGPANALGAGVHREGDELDRALRASDLDPVEGVVDPGEGVDLEEGAAPAIELREGPSRRVYKKRAFRGRRLPRKARRCPEGPAAAREEGA